MQAACWGPYALCGWRVQSRIVLPELHLWNDALPPGRRLRIELGAVSGGDEFRHFSITSRSDVILRIAGLAHILIQAGSPHEEDTVTIQLEENADQLLLRNYLYGSVLAVLCYKRRLLPLHGSSVRMHDGAVIFSGPSGAGKSMLATALARSGYPLLSDDVCAIDLRDVSRPLLWPAITRVKLLQDAIETFQLGTTAVYMRAAYGEKGHFGMAGLECIADANNPVPVAAIYAIDTSHGMVMDRRPLRGKERFNFLDSQAHRSWMGRALGSHQDIFRQLAALSRAVPVYRLQRPRSLLGMEEATAFLRQMHPDMVITPPLLNSEEFTSGEQHDR